MNITERLQCDIPSDWPTDFSQCLFEWQGLEGGILALVAAGFSVWFLWCQIRQSDRHEQGRLERQHAAVRATMPLTLSGMVDPLRQMLLKLEAAKEEVRRNGVASSFEPPLPPDEFVTQLQQVIGSTSNKSIIEPISQIIREIQTLWARVRTLQDERDQRRRAGLMQNIDEWIIQTAQVHALVESLFEYARGEHDNGPSAVGWERAESIIFQLGMESRELSQVIQRGLATSPSFWVLK